MGEGADSRAYTINDDEYIFKFPRTDEAAASYKQEIAVLKLLESTHLSLMTPIVNPAKLREITFKQWGKQVRRVMKRRAATTETVALIELSTQIAIMQSITFELAPPADLLECGILFAKVAEFKRYPPVCDILIVATSIDSETLTRLTHYMHEQSRVIIAGAI